MRKFFHEYFNYSAKELRPLYYLIVILLLSIVIRSTMNNPATSEFIPDQALIKMNKSFIESLKIKEVSKKQNYSNQKVFISEPFKFDPNTVDIDQLKKFGFDSKILSNLNKYREAGGKFFKPADLKKIYGMTDNLYSEIENWVTIQPTTKENNLPVFTNDSLSINVSPKILELNSLLFKDLIKISGGDAKMTGRIINYKNLLGGYYSIKQLLEVYEMTDSLFNSIYPAVIIDTTLIRTLSLNRSEYSDFLRHPYLDKMHVNLILKYREYKKSNIEIDEFIENKILSDSLLGKMLPYLSN